MSQKALLQRHNAPLKHGRRSPTLVSLGNKFGCTKPELHEGEPGKFDPENCDYCKARYENLMEARALLGSVSENLMERAVTTKIDIENYRKKLEEEGKHPLQDSNYYKWAKLDLELAKYLADKAVGNKVNVYHHKGDEEEDLVIDVTRLQNEDNKE